MHKYELEIDGLKILDFQSENILSWLAELMKHREVADSKRYRMLSKKFIEKYGIETKEYDVIKGWRANASYFYIAKMCIRDRKSGLYGKAFIIQNLIAQCLKHSDTAFACSAPPDSNDKFPASTAYAVQYHFTDAVSLSLIHI